MPSTPHNDLHPAARDHTDEEGREESHCNLRVKHCHCPRETLVLRSRPHPMGLGNVLDHHFPDVAARRVERREENPVACAAKILLALNLVIWNAAIYSTLVVRDVVLAELR
jgi:hypothetical protein